MLSLYGTDNITIRLKIYEGFVLRQICSLLLDVPSKKAI